MDDGYYFLQEKFAESEFLEGINEKLGGAICMQFDKVTKTILKSMEKMYIFDWYRMRLYFNELNDFFVCPFITNS